MKTLLSVPAVKAARPSRYRLAARHAYLCLSAITNARHRAECPCCGASVGEEDYVERCDQSQRTRYGLRVGEPFSVYTKPIRP